MNISRCGPPASMPSSPYQHTLRPWRIASPASTLITCTTSQPALIPAVTEELRAMWAYPCHDILPYVRAPNIDVDGCDLSLWKKAVWGYGTEGGTEGMREVPARMCPTCRRGEASAADPPDLQSIEGRQTSMHCWSSVSRAFTNTKYFAKCVSTCVVATSNDQGCVVMDERLACHATMQHAHMRP